MSFKFSRCLCLQTENLDEAAAFYTRIMGLKIVHQENYISGFGGYAYDRTKNIFGEDFSVKLVRKERDEIIKREENFYSL